VSIKDKDLKEKFLNFYTEDLEQIDKLLEAFINLSKSKAIFLIDKSGNMITKKGSFSSINPDQLSALVAGSFAATKEMARLLGESEFSVMFHQGKKDHIHISLVGDKAIAATVFGGDTTTGMISLYAKELSEKLGKIFDIISRRLKRKGDQKLTNDFTDSVKDKLDDLFGD
jgi:predicted regulator of Ras-like GTPase activity (Roadblock/LC7/MglB family)